jgi:glycerol uptake facilitator
LGVVVIGMSFGSLYGYAINPARDFGPRLVTVMAGYSKNGLTDGSSAYLIPIVGPLIGGLIGTFAYDKLVRRWLAKPEQVIE